METILHFFILLKKDIQEKITKTTPWKESADAKMIADTIINDPKYKDKLEDELVEYYTGFIKKQWTMGEANRPRPKVKKDKEIKPPTNDRKNINFA